MWKYELRTEKTGHQMENGNFVALNTWGGFQDMFNDVGSRGWEWAGTTTDLSGQTVWVFRYVVEGPSESN